MGRYIEDMDHDGRRVVLVDATTGEAIAKGDERTLRDGTRVRITGGRAPRHAASTGRVHLEEMPERGGAGRFERYPSVVGATWADAKAEPQDDVA